MVKLRVSHVPDTDFLGHERRIFRINFVLISPVTRFVPRGSMQIVRVSPWTRPFSLR